MLSHLVSMINGMQQALAGYMYVRCGCWLLLLSREKDKCLVVITPAVSTLTSPVLCSICLCGSDLRAAIGCSMSKAEKRLVLFLPEIKKSQPSFSTF